MLIIPSAIWNKLLIEFSSAPKYVEKVAYFDGVERGDTKVVTTLVIPNAKIDEYNYRVSADSMSEAGKHLRTYRIVRLAQIHTHPSTDVRHSIWDDEMAYSQFEGAISIVVPNYAKDNKSPSECGIHIKGSDGWRMLDTELTEQSILVVPSYLDFR